MVVMQRNPVAGPRIVPFGSLRTSTDVLTNGRPGFRVTQRFADTDQYFGGRHGAIDLGNYYCGDTVMAVAPGVHTQRRDVYGALISEVRHADGTVTGYGHLSSFLAGHGFNVVAGQPIGRVGDTGLGGVCHLHFYVRNQNGILVDPWPMLPQNTQRRARFNSVVGPVNLRKSPGGAVTHRLRAGAFYRASDGVRVASIKEGATFIARNPVVGTYHGLGTSPQRSLWTPCYLMGYYRYVATPLLRYTS